MISVTLMMQAAIPVGMLVVMRMMTGMKMTMTMTMESNVGFSYSKRPDAACLYVFRYDWRSTQKIQMASGVWYGASLCRGSKAMGERSFRLEAMTWAYGSCLWRQSERLFYKCNMSRVAYEKLVARYFSFGNTISSVCKRRT
jgi:hypothetical protein